MVGKKKGVSGQKETNQTETGEEGKENREKGGEKDAARRRGGATRKGRGASRGRECECFPHLYSYWCFFCIAILPNINAVFLKLLVRDMYNCLLAFCSYKQYEI